MKLLLVATLIVCAFPQTLSAESYSRVETSVFTSSSQDGSVESRIETSGNAEVRIYTVINGEVVEGVHLKGEDAVYYENTETVELNTPRVSRITDEALDEDVFPAVTPVVQVIESLESGSIIDYLRNQDFFLTSTKITPPSHETKVEKTGWSAFVLAFNQFFTHFF